MKSIIIFLILCFFTGVLYSQKNKEYEVIKTDPGQQQFDFVPDQILVKLKDDVTALLGKTNGYASTGNTSIDLILQKYKVVEFIKLFPDEKKPLTKRLMKTPSGQELEQPSLHNIYKLRIDSTQQVNLFKVIEELKKDPNVIYAEPNYIFSIVESNPLSPELNESEMREWILEHPEIKVNYRNEENTGTKINKVIPNDPLYSQQWGIPACQIDAVWDSTKGDSTQIIAVLDTGVDWLHPDLKDNIWINHAEAEGTAGVDDDSNGKIDDIRGWDYINNDNDPKDDNSHGTHVAGITAARGNNGLGIAGVNWYAKIMPVKVFQSSGRGDAATITQGIIYAKNKGATVINMSFGSYARSFTMEDALASAYTGSILVAAAGNDSRNIGPPPFPFPVAFYPAALSYVLGIQVNESFSNCDLDGPVFSGYSDLLNYELTAPGINIISSVPNGNYRLFQGTSMAAPIVSGGVALYKIIRPNDSQELMWGNLINTSKENVKFHDAANIIPKPVLWFVNQNLIDTLDGDKDFRVDAGETLELWFTIRNTWGQSDSAFVGLRLGEFEDTSIVQILKHEAFIGSVSAYAKRTNEFMPLRIRISKTAANNRDIVLNAMSWYKGSQDTIDQKIVLTIENGEELSGVMDSSLVLTSDKLWLINQSFRVGLNGTLIINPGTEILLNQNMVNRGKIIGIGTEDSIIVVKGPGSIIDDGVTGILEFKYSLFSELRSAFSGKAFKFTNCVFNDIVSIGGVANGGALFNWGNITMNDNVIMNSSFGRLFSWGMDRPLNFRKNNVVNCLIYTGGMLVNTLFNDYVPQGYNNFVKIRNFYYVLYGNESNPSPLFSYTVQPPFYNNFLGVGKHSYFAQGMGSSDIIKIPNQYWGTTNIQKIHEMNFDFRDNPLFPMLDYQPILTTPSDSAHGIVWKILVNGKDAQDEKVDPVGVGPQRFDVYFNRPMDKRYPPQIAFGVREPFTQQAVSDSGKWTEDGRIYTAYKTIKLYTGDGINRIRVSGARDLEDWEIPVEDQRFEFLIDAAGSASTEFIATAGLGKVNLEWRNPETVPDLLGYNMYRFQQVTDTTFTNPVIINTSLINDTLYNDFSVEPTKKYYYYYKVVRTDFTESDSSRIVNATPVTASAGDANGDLTVTVQDIVSVVAYLLNQNPQPFIFEAADVNSDGQINVLDVVAIVNISMGVLPKELAAVNKQPLLTFDKKTVYINDGESTCGMQFKLAAKINKNTKIVAGDQVEGLELGTSIQGDTINIILYSFRNNKIKSGKGILFKILDGEMSKLEKVTASDSKGDAINVKYENDGLIIPKDFMLYQNYPNPFNPATTIRYALPKMEDVEITIYNILGERVWYYSIMDQQPGFYEVIWNSINSNNIRTASGVYIYQISAGKFNQQKKMVLLK